MKQGQGKRVVPAAHASQVAGERIAYHIMCSKEYPLYVESPLSIMISQKDRRKMVRYPRRHVFIIVILTFFSIFWSNPSLTICPVPSDTIYEDKPKLK